MINSSNIKNIYKLENQKIEKIIQIINAFYKNVETDTLLKPINELDISKLLSYTMFLGEIYDLLPDESRRNELRSALAREIKWRVETKEISDLNIYNGLVQANIVLKILSDNTGCYKNFTNQLEDYLLEEMDKKLNTLSMIKICRTDFYDLILGVSGWMIYLTEFCSSNKKKNIMIKILNYLNKIVAYKNINGYSIPGWYVRNEDLLTAYDKDTFPNGYINFGLSHGAAGILLALSISYNQGMRTLNQKNCILKLFDVFIEKSYKVNGIFYYPGILSFEEYIENNYMPEKQRNSWCYGNIGIMCSLFQAARAINRLDLQDKIEKQIINLAELKLEEHLFNSPVICHGYSGLILLFDWYNKINSKEIFINAIKEITDLLICSNIENIASDFMDMDKKGNKKDTFSVLDGSFGCVLTLLTLVKDNLQFQKSLGFITTLENNDEKK